MIIPVPEETVVHRIGGASVENLRLGDLDRSAFPPGISVLLGGSPEEAADRIRRAFKNSKKWQRLSKRIASSTAGEIFGFGFSVIECATHKLPNHGRIIHPAGIDGFEDSNLIALSRAFQLTEVD